MNFLKDKFNFLQDAEKSIEVDPRTVNKERLMLLKKLGFNRYSFGVQDFDPNVQKAIHRLQPYTQVESLVNDCREIGIDSINLDLIYGLPLQTTDTFQDSLEKVLELSPERIAIYAYAHLPQRFKPQRRINDDDLPSAQDKVSMLTLALNVLQAQGYEYIGMDHFAKKTDSLTIAKMQGKLHRNFQGYSTQPDGDLLAFGVSSIGKVGTTYSQNAKTIEQYEAFIARGEIPVVKGYSLNHDDLIRRAVIMSIMCQGEFNFEQIGFEFNINCKKYFEKELNELNEFKNQRLIVISDYGFNVTEMGWYFVRAIAMIFDEYLSSNLQAKKFSKIL
jgi:oxygen-independent coproporphyrinogen-3 oxidase